MNNIYQNTNFTEETINMTIQAAIKNSASDLFKNASFEGKCPLSTCHI